MHDIALTDSLQHDTTQTILEDAIVTMAYHEIAWNNPSRRSDKLSCFWRPWLENIKASYRPTPSIPRQSNKSLRPEKRSWTQTHTVRQSYFLARHSTMCRADFSRHSNHKTQQNSPPSLRHYASIATLVLKISLLATSPKMREPLQIGLQARSLKNRV